MDLKLLSNFCTPIEGNAANVIAQKIEKKLVESNSLALATHN